MGSDSEYIPPGQRFQKYLMELFEKFKKTPYTIPVGAAIIAGVFYLLLVVLFDSCLVTLIPPFLMLGVYWMFNIKRAKKLLLAGFIGCLAMFAAETYFFVGYFSDVEPVEARSENGLLTDGYVTPLKADMDTTVFNYTVKVNVNTSASTIEDVTVLIMGLNDFWNESMTLLSSNDTVATYYYTTTLSDPINYYVFWARIDGQSYVAAHFEDMYESPILGPISTDRWHVAQPVAYYSALQTLVQFFGIYALIVGMIWWTRRARRMRMEQISKWEEKQKKALKDAPKEETKVPSLAKAMGLEEDETSVCSECGADVPGDATVCPKCGEKCE